MHTVQMPAIENQIRDREETLPREELAALQLARLREVVARVANVPFYREAFALRGITAKSLRSLDDLRRLPFTTKDDLRRHHPLGFLTVPRDQLARIHLSPQRSNDHFQPA